MSTGWDDLMQQSGTSTVLTVRCPNQLDAALGDRARRNSFRLRADLIDDHNLPIHEPSPQTYTVTSRSTLQGSPLGTMVTP